MNNISRVHPIGPGTHAAGAQSPSSVPQLRRSGVLPDETRLNFLLHELAVLALKEMRASGIAIALAQEEGGMVCSAAVGLMESDLGYPVNTSAGLVGSCVQSLQPQWCMNTVADIRVDADACRTLDIRSIFVVPILEDDFLIGVLQVLYRQPYGFGTRDLVLAEEIAQQITAEIRKDRGPTSDIAAVENSNVRHRHSAGLHYAAALLLVLVLCGFVAFAWGCQKSHTSTSTALTRTNGLVH